MDIFLAMGSAQAAAMNVGLLILVMLGLKMYVGGQRGKLKVPSGETTPEFSRVTRVQLNAVEDVPVLMAGLVALGLLGMPAWYIHMCGLVLVVSRYLLCHCALCAARRGLWRWNRRINDGGCRVWHADIAC